MPYMYEDYGEMRIIMRRITSTMEVAMGQSDSKHSGSKSSSRYH